MSTYEIYYWLLTNREKIISVASGATFKEINRGTFRQLPVLLADERTRCQFASVMEPMTRQIETLEAKNRNLRDTRDLQLPKLIAGEVDVASAAMNGTGCE